MKVLSIIFATLMIGLLALDPYIQAHYAYTRPAKPDLINGRVYEFNMRGRVVYLNENEYRITFWTFKVGALAGLIAGGFWTLADKKKKERKKE